jgi:hypothetical protein
MRHGHFRPIGSIWKEHGNGTYIECESGSRRTGSNEFARARFRVNFSASERELNIPFLVFADLYERDDALDTMVAHDVNLFAAQLPRGNRDDLVGEIARQTVRPNGNSFVDLDLRREFDFGNQESGNEEYVALISAYPDIRGDTRFSNEVSANLG